MELFCPAPWAHSCIHADGTIRPCCVSGDVVGDTLQGDTLQSVWDGKSYKELRAKLLNHEIPHGCRSCVEDEKLGSVPQKNLVIKHFDQFASEEYKQDFKNLSTLGKDLISLDLSLGNKCNLRCRFCGPRFSHLWRSDANQLIKRNPEFWASQGVEQSSVRSDHSLDLESLISDMDRFKGIRYLMLKGGEPLLNPTLPKFLQALIDNGEAKNISIHFNSNLTVVPPEFLEQVPHFDSIAISVSIDGAGKLYQYIRGERFRLENEIGKNIALFNKFKNINLRVHFVLCALNIFGVREFANWFENVNYKRLLSWKFRSLSSPRALRVLNIPRSIRLEAAARLEGVDDDNFRKIRSLLMSDFEPEKDHINAFVTHTRDLDFIRKTNILDVVPEFKPLF